MRNCILGAKEAEIEDGKIENIESDPAKKKKKKP